MSLPVRVRNRDFQNLPLSRQRRPFWRRARIGSNAADALKAAVPVDRSTLRPKSGPRAQSKEPGHSPNDSLLRGGNTDDRFWPGRAKAEFKLAAVNQSSKAGRREKL
jgi:hypothetical protein